MILDRVACRSIVMILLGVSDFDQLSSRTYDKVRLKL